jgi:hypothetical protein
MKGLLRLYMGTTSFNTIPVTAAVADFVLGGQAAVRAVHGNGNRSWQ